MSLFHLYLSFPPYIKLLGGKCLTYYGTEGKPGKFFDKRGNISTYWNSDVFYELIKKLYGIAWS
jgi:hypothetical protein